MKLTPTHQKILSTLIYLYNKYDRPLRASEVAQITGHNVGTIRNNMQILKMLKIIKGIPGPKGGYIPTSRIFERFSSSNDETRLNIHLNKTKLEDIRICEIKLSPRDYSTYSGSIQIIGNMKNFNVGDTITIQNSINNNTVIKGTITGKDFINNTIYSSPIEILAE